MGGLAGYKQYLHRQIGSYLAEHIQMPPLAVVLIATITSKATGPGSLRPGEQEEEQEALAGTLELSFNPATRSTYLTLNPPKTCSYLCNMAVAPEFRRRGYGATLLKAAESFAALAGKDDIYLHVRSDPSHGPALASPSANVAVRKVRPSLRCPCQAGRDSRQATKNRLPAVIDPPAMRCIFLYRNVVA